MRSTVYGIALILAIPLPATVASAAAPGGDAAPEFTLYDTYGQPVSLKGYRGSVAWISFGATW